VIKSSRERERERGNRQGRARTGGLVAAEVCVVFVALAAVGTHKGHPGPVRCWWQVTVVDQVGSEEGDQTGNKRQNRGGQRRTEAGEEHRWVREGASGFSPSRVDHGTNAASAVIGPVQAGLYHSIHDVVYSSSHDPLPTEYFSQRLNSLSSLPILFAAYNLAISKDPLSSLPANPLLPLSVIEQHEHDN